MSSAYPHNEVQACAAMAKGGSFERFTIKRRQCEPNDVEIDIKFAGICHSDIHQVREEWGKAAFPMVPGHEIGGFVSAVGSNVTDFKVGDRVGVGCMVDSCRKCEYCNLNEEQFCMEGASFTYNSRHKWNCQKDSEDPTYGGYSKSITVNKDFVCRIPANLDLAAATPLLCAGITCYSPLVHYGLQQHHKAAVLGLGGLGHIAVKIMKARGNHTTVISRGVGKKDDALKTLKADAFIDSTNESDIKAATKSFDFILSTISAKYSLEMYLNMLKTGGKLILVGAPELPLETHAMSLLARKLTLAGSLIGGIKETQEMLDFCGKHGVACDVEVIKADDIAIAYDRAVNSDVKFRFVIDTSTI